MAYYLDLFSPETYEAFSKSSRDVSGFRMRQLMAAQKIAPGDILICYMTKLSRWIGILHVSSVAYIDESPLFYDEDDPFVVRFQVQPLVWLPKEKAVPIHEIRVWDHLSFTKGHDGKSSTWTGKLRASLTKIEESDGTFLEKLIKDQSSNGQIYEVDEEAYRKYVTQRVRRLDRTVKVTVPEDRPEPAKDEEQTRSIRESSRQQALLAQIGEKMGFKIWLPRQDRIRVLQEWSPEDDILLDRLPLNYDETTLRTIEQIDVLWLKRRFIVRAFEVEHTTAIYSGILRMADLLALQPNMDIKIHIVAPYERRDKVFEEIQRPVFSLIEKGPLSEFCTFISYDSLEELAQIKHLTHLSDSVLDEYMEEAE